MSEPDIQVLSIYKKGVGTPWVSVRI